MSDEELPEFVYELRHHLGTAPTPLIERNPLMFWKALSFVLMLVIMVLLYSKYG